MIDIQLIRENPELVAEKAKQKGIEVDINQLLGFDNKRKELLVTVEEKRRQRNEHAAMFKQSKGTTSQENIDKGKALKDELANLEHEFDAIDLQYKDLMKLVPNMPLDSVPVGSSEDENKVTKSVGEPKKFDFEPKTHWQIAEAKGWLDKERAAKVTGSRFAYIKGDLVKLQFAIIQLITDKLSDQAFLDEIIKENNLDVSNKPFLPILPPFMLRTELYDAMDRLEPREDRYKIEGEDLWLQGSAEHVLGSMHSGEVFNENELPIRYIGYATSFRREAGTYGKDMEGMFRMHQFDKLEMESIGLSENGYKEHLFMIAIQEKIMQILEIPYQVLTKCTADIGKPNASGVDIEAWLPGQNKYRETHTADYMTDYQARRLKTRVRREEGLELVHTNDATALPLSRGPIALIENHQDKNGDVAIPKALQQYMNGKEKI